jgi:hypothetical protein
MAWLKVRMNTFATTRLDYELKTSGGALYYTCTSIRECTEGVLI